MFVQHNNLVYYSFLGHRSRMSSHHHVHQKYSPMLQSVLCLVVMNTKYADSLIVEMFGASEKCLVPSRNLLVCCESQHPLLQFHEDSTIADPTVWYRGIPTTQEISQATNSKLLLQTKHLFGVLRVAAPKIQMYIQWAARAANYSHVQFLCAVISKFWCAANG